MSPIKLDIHKKIPNALGRAGILHTPHGDIKTPAFVTVGTKATVKSLTPEQISATGSQVVLANTYHLYFEPGHEIVKEAGGLQKFMNWQGPTMTDSGGFQAFSLGEAFGLKLSKIGGEFGRSDSAESDLGKGITKVASGSGAETAPEKEFPNSEKIKQAEVHEEGVTFTSPKDGSKHTFTPEKSIEIQHAIGADMIFAFDECTSPYASYEYQKEALERTHRWAERCLTYHKNANTNQALLGIVQGGRFRDLREESAKKIASMDGFDGFGIGGSFDKNDLGTAVKWVNEILPEEKPRHLLGIGEIGDLFSGIEHGVDLFDCVLPTRLARNGSLYTKDGRINLMNAQFVKDFSPIEVDCKCYTCANFTKAYLAHLFRSKEILANTLASIHNVHFVVNLVKTIRQSILDGNFFEYKNEFLNRYSHN